MAGKVTPTLEDFLLDCWQQRRQLSEKSLCARYDIARSTLRLAIKRAQRRRAESPMCKMLDDKPVAIG